MVTGVSGSVTLGGGRSHLRRVLVTALEFIAGFTLVFVLLGVSITAVGQALAMHRVLLGSVSPGSSCSPSPCSCCLPRRARPGCTGHLPAAVNFDLYASDFSKQLEVLDEDRSYFVYCQNGKRSQTAAEMMQTLGGKHVYDIEGGMTVWQNNSLLTSK